MWRDWRDWTGEVVCKGVLWGHARDTTGPSADGRFAGGKAVVFEERYVCEGSS